MKTRIKTAHEEEYSDKSKILGVLMNYSTISNESDSFVYIYRNEMYIFFNTIVDMIDYLLYGDTVTVKRYYMEEKLFDELYDKEIDGKFIDVLKSI